MNIQLLCEVKEFAQNEKFQHLHIERFNIGLKGSGHPCTAALLISLPLLITKGFCLK